MTDERKGRHLRGLAVVAAAGGGGGPSDERCARCYFAECKVILTADGTWSGTRSSTTRR